MQTAGEKVITLGATRFVSKENNCMKEEQVWLLLPFVCWLWSEQNSISLTLSRRSGSSCAY